MTTSSNLLAGIRLCRGKEFLDPLIQSPNCRIERIVSIGYASPEGFWYDQEWPEWVVVIQGAARIMFEERVVSLKPGDHLFIPAHQKHRVDWTCPDNPTVWLAVHWPEP